MADQFLLCLFLARAMPSICLPQQAICGSIRELMDLVQHMACSGVQVAQTMTKLLFGLGQGRMLEHCSIGVRQRPKVTL